MLIFDFFAGTGSSTQAFVNAGHTVIKIELDEQFEAEERDVLAMSAEYLISKYGKPDFVWASPPCTTFSVASIGHHWLQGGANPIPKTKEAVIAQDLVKHTLKLIQELNPPKGWLVENPRGMLRKLPVVKDYERRTVTYCQYGDTRMKPTDLWGTVPNWIARTPCKNGMPCHVAAPRGSMTGTQGIEGAKNRSRVPYELGLELMETMEAK